MGSWNENGDDDDKPHATRSLGIEPRPHCLKAAIILVKINMIIIFLYFAVQKGTGKRIHRKRHPLFCKWNAKDRCGFGHSHGRNPTGSQKDGIK